jgi:hypothetical protein
MLNDVFRVGHMFDLKSFLVTITLSLSLSERFESALTEILSCIKILL